MNCWLMATGAIHCDQMHDPLKGMPIKHLVQRNDHIRKYDRVYLFMWNVGVFGWGPIDDIDTHPELVQGNEMQTVTVPASEVRLDLALTPTITGLPDFVDILSKFDGNFVALTPKMVNSLHGLIRMSGGRCPPDVSEVEDKRDRITEDFGILLSKRYLNPDLQDALDMSADASVAVIVADMDNFGPINKTYGMGAGDEVMKAYLTAVRDAIGDFGTGYRGVGDETFSIIIGQDRERVAEIAYDICRRVRSLIVEHKGKPLPKVTASIGVTISPPGPRSLEVLTLAGECQIDAKRQGKDRVVAS